MDTPKVTVPTAKDLGIDIEPLDVSGYVSEAGGAVRPVVVVALMNRETKRRVERKMRRHAQRHPDQAAPIILPVTLPAAEVTARMADELMREYEEYNGYFPLKTLSDYLDDRTAKTLEEAMKQGRPLDRDAVRRAIGNLMQEHENETKGAS